VAITRRDYPGSTPFSEEELRVASKGSRKEKLGFLRDRAIEIWEFVRKFVKVNSIPRWNKSDGKGGVVVMGWSMGNSQGLGAMAYAREIKGVREELEPWMKGYIIYGEKVFFAYYFSRNLDIFFNYRKSFGPSASRSFALVLALPGEIPSSIRNDSSHSNHAIVLLQTPEH